LTDIFYYHKKIKCQRGSDVPQPAPSEALEALFIEARSHNGWRDTPVAESVLRHAFDLAKLGPTSANCSPGRFVFLQALEARQRLAPHVSAGNRRKVLTAPVCIVMAYDRNFADRLIDLFPHKPEAKAWFSNPAMSAETAFRNSTLQGAYLMLALRALGLDCGPMSGFDQDGVDREFFAGTSWVTNFLCSVGEGDPDALFPRLPRLAFEDACWVL
jgi:3-hydroxypropanoate dehydrogenase